MNTVGIIAEYNPCHNGHKYHIEESRKRTNADCVVSIISGSFVQRGAPAVADKFTRARCALLSGADLVIELPVVYSTGSAELFASGAVNILDKLGGISHISFGSECDNLEILDKIAQVLAFESQTFQSLLKKYIATGIGMPAARQAALAKILNMPEITTIIGSPNNILAIEYLKALKRFNSKITAVNIMRKNNSYHDKNLTGSISSATAIRELIEKGNFSDVRHAIPEAAYGVFQDIYQKTFPINANDCSILLDYAVTDKFNKLSVYSDVGEALANKIRLYFSNAEKSYRWNDIAIALKSRDLTYTRVCRGLIHILLGIDSEFITSVRNAGFPSYVRILGFNEKGREFLSFAKKDSLIPIISNCSDDYNKLDDMQRLLFEYDIKATRIYNSIVYSRYGIQLKDDYRCRPLYIDD